ncbi:membrane protein involved in the export of O-antigen and teichoic acid [Desulfocapsa sulfexigens DSM 10523]|uniref:Membrane protein involved in the export of O-antigen and teichoic acid n=1 Tax=Desulfocapsa sulfexigens (strain DSM 10523 / SB164P1) TaxID=1167006 RepID=M1NFB9_DESSD|nr:oligosaccharide flippase family protein [Desulfocapsa sulfexigens]AGF78364.1 membrane protein involved in the export of O-antigen and teichoic acid [Desulfocapsa sulfexigens DSM 10523]
MHTAYIKTLFKTQRGRLNNLSILLFSNIYMAGLGFVTTIKIANALGAAKFGELTYAIAVGTILAANIRFGMDRSLIRDLTHYPGRFNETLTVSLLIRGLLFCLCSITLLILVTLPDSILNISWGMFWICIATMLSPLQIANVFDVWECQGRHAIYSCAERTIYFILIWTVLFLEPARLNLELIGGALTIAVLFFLILQYHYAWKRLTPNLKGMSIKHTKKSIFALLSSNKWLWMASLATLALTALNSIALKHAAGFSDLGVYGASFQLLSIGTLLLKNIARIGRPILARQTTPGSISGRGIIHFLVIYLAFAILAVSIIALPAIVIPKKILLTFFIPEYANGYWVLRLFGICLLAYVFDILLGQFIILLRIDKVFFSARLAAGMVSLTACLILAPHFGATGAAIALLAGEVILATVYILKATKYIKKLPTTCL